VTDRRRFCVVSETYPPDINGVALTLRHLVHGLRAHGHAVSIVRPRRPGLDGGGDHDVTLVGGVALPGYRDVRLGFPGRGQLREAWTRRRPDAMYVATEGPLGWSAVVTAARLGIPVVTGFHTNFHIYAQHYRLGWLRRAVFGYLRHFHNRTRGTLVATADLRDHLHALGFQNLSVIGRGVDRRRFNPERRSRALRAAWGASDDGLVALYVGRVASEKNVPLAIEAYRAMRRVVPSLVFAVVGDGPLRPALQSTNPDVRFCGMQTGEALAAHYASADVFLFPSETETFGNVCLEAAASGLAVVAYDYAAAHVYLAHGYSGVLVPSGRPETFVDRAVTLASSPSWMRDIRRNARAAVAEADWDRVVERFEQILTTAAATGCPMTTPAARPALEAT